MALVHRSAALFAGVLLSCMPSARAEPASSDPTRPPNAVNALVPLKPHAASPAASSVPPKPLQLQSVQLFSVGQSTALVDGQLVTVGTRLADMAVIAIDEQGVLLRGARRDQRLTLLPETTKRALSASPQAERHGATSANQESR